MLGQSLIAAGLPAAIMALICIMRSRLGLSTTTLGIILGALLLCACHIAFSSATDFPLDLPLHEEYIRFIVDYQHMPGQADIAASYHLPSYYLIASGPYAAAQQLGLDPVQTIRYLAFICYAAYLLIAAQCLRQILATPDHASCSGTCSLHYALTLLAFWPIGIIISGRIHPEVIAFTGQIGMFSSIILWAMHQQTKHLAAAFFFAAIFMLGRNYAVFFVWMLFGCLAYHAIKNRHQLFTKENRLLWLCVALCIASYAFNAWHRELMPKTAADIYTPPASSWEWLKTLLYFNPWLFVTETMLTPNIGASKAYHMHYFIRSGVLGGFTHWTAWPAAFALGVIWLAMIAYTVWGFAAHTWRSLSAVEKCGYAVILFFIAMLAAMSMGARFLHPHMLNISDARYVFPISALFILCFGRTLIAYKQLAKPHAFAIGRGLALGMIGLSITLIIGEIQPSAHLL